MTAPLDKWPLPSCLRDAALFRDLSASDQHGFHTRLLRIMEVVDQAEFDMSEADADLFDIFDNLELDVGVSLATRNANCSPWLVSSRWARRFSIGALNEALVVDVKSSIDCDIAPSLTIDRALRALKSALFAIFGADELVGVVAHLIAVEFLLSWIYMTLLRHHLRSPAPDA